MLTATARKTLDAQLVKLADDDDGNEGSFEQSLSDVVHLVLKDKAAELLDYELGFQLIDRDVEANKAVGVTCFKIGPNYLFAPAFFLAGKLKGSELLYCKNLDTFLPLSENWIQHLLSKNPDSLGTPTSRNLGQLGVSTPDLRQITRPPTKFADARFREDVLPNWARSLTSDPLKAAAYSLEDFIKEAGRPAVEALVHLIRECPRLAHDVARYHGDGLLAACKEASAKYPAPRKAASSPVGDSLFDDPAPLLHPSKSGELREILYDKAEADPSLFGPQPEDTRPEANRFTVVDQRENNRVSTPYMAQVDQRLTNPTETGLYDVLMRPRTYEKCFVATSPQTAHGVIQPCTVVRLSDKKFINAHPSVIWVGKLYSRKEFEDWRDELPDASSMDVHKPSEYSRSREYQILIDEMGNTSAPVQAEFALGDADGGTSYKVRFCTHRSDGCVPEIQAVPSMGGSNYEFPRNDGFVAVGTDRGGRMFHAAGTLVTPAGTRVLDVTEPEYYEPVIQLGQPLDIHLDLHRKLDKLEVQKKRGEYLVNGESIRGERAALRHLVFDHGFRQGAAEEILEKAAAAGRDYADPVFRCLVKYADPYLYDRQPGSVGIPEPQMTTEETLTQSLPGMPRQMHMLPQPDMRQRDDVDEVYNLRKLPPPPWMLNSIQQAAQTGSREVFDTSMIGSMLSTTQGDLQVDRFFGPLMKGMDAIGRILMNLYWHGSDFEERYGKNDVVGLEDMLRNTFISMGKLILGLKEKGVEDPLDANRDLDLDQASDQ